MFQELTDDLLDLVADEEGVGDALYAFVVDLCTTASCTCTVLRK